MDWLKNNPVLGALAAAALLVVLLGGYFAYSASARFSEEQMTFDGKKSQLETLWTSKPYPDAANAEAAEREAKDTADMIAALGKLFSAPMPALTPQAFQDELSSAVKEIQALAAQKGVVLGEEFYLGFEAYETQPPSETVAAQLGLQLRSIEATVRALIDSEAKSVESVTRPPLPGESGATVAANKDPAEDKPKSFALLPFDVAFTADQPSLRLALNRVSELKPPVFIRLVSIENSSPQPPPKSGGADAPPQEPTADATGKQGIEPILGREFLRVELRLASVAGQPET